MIGHKISLNKLIKFYQTFFQPQWYETKNKENSQRRNTCTLKKNMLLKSQWVHEEVKEKNQKIAKDKWKLKHNTWKSMGYNKSTVKDDV